MISEQRQERRPAGDNRPVPARTLASALREAWRYRDLLAVLTVRQTKIKFQNSMIGMVWALAGPAITVGILFVVFTNFVRLGIEQYWAFLLSGYFVFHSVSQSLTICANVPLEYSTMYQNAAFPAEVPILANVASRFIEFLIAFAIAALMVVLFRQMALPVSLVLLPFLILLQILVTVGLCLPIAVLSLFSYDFRNALPLALMCLFYLTPVFYTVDIVPAEVRPFLYVNPLTSLIQCYQTVLYDGRFPALWLLALAAGYAVLVFLTGYAVFNRVRTIFAEAA